MSWQDHRNINLKGGIINNTTIGEDTPAPVYSTILEASISIHEATSPVVVQADIGTEPEQVPLNQHLGTLAYQDANGVNISGIIRTLVTTVSELPSASYVGAGTRLFVTDATSTTFLSTVSGGGSNSVPVVSDGTNWLIG
jgi:hypothetical protein